jgi:hypothetical protein
MLINKILDEDEENKARQSFEACSRSYQGLNSGKVNYGKKQSFIHIYNNDLKVFVFFQLTRSRKELCLYRNYCTEIESY